MGWSPSTESLEWVRCQGWVVLCEMEGGRRTGASVSGSGRKHLFPAHRLFFLESQGQQIQAVEIEII